MREQYAAQNPPHQMPDISSLKISPVSPDQPDESTSTANASRIVRKRQRNSIANSSSGPCLDDSLRDNVLEYWKNKIWVWPVIELAIVHLHCLLGLHDPMASQDLQTVWARDSFEEATSFLNAPTFVISSGLLESVSCSKQTVSLDIHRAS